MLAQLGNVWLADGTRPGGYGITLESGAANWLVEVSPRPRATSVELFDRGNQQRSFAFSVSRHFESQEAADLFVLEHAESLDRTQLLKLISRERGSGRETVRWLRSSKLESLEFPELIGVSIRVRYAFRGAFISTSET